jgi:hypothetical protein
MLIENRIHQGNFSSTTSGLRFRWTVLKKFTPHSIFLFTPIYIYQVMTFYKHMHLQNITKSIHVNKQDVFMKYWCLRNTGAFR